MQKMIPSVTRAYWKESLVKGKDVRMLTLAALCIALRIAVRSVTIPLMENLYVSIEFLPMALGSLVYGPFVALLAGAASDVLGALLFPKGAFFPPFMLVNMLQAFLFAFFLYGQPLRLSRVILSKASVNLLCNIILTPIMLTWMYGDAAYLISLPRIIKNIALLPVEAALLYALLRALWPSMRRMRLIPATPK